VAPDWPQAYPRGYAVGMAHDHGKTVLDGLAEPARALRQQIPDVMKAFAGLHSAALVDGALSSATKELIALAIAVVSPCDGCIASHARGAARHGATKEQVAEAIGVAILMAGGPATVYGPRAYDAFMEFAAPAQEGPTS
jgi:AhpD family alkylhydroperoxidase